MRLSRSNQTFGMTGLFLATIGVVYLIYGGQRTSILQATILTCSGASFIIIALINMLINQIRLLWRRYYNPLSRWSQKGGTSIFNFKG